ncbi:hypothetical protein [Thauera sp.]|uniref:hypothetical protein n=1 Tax=Thauera sp. TaxID=1905334 RepID=UPI0039E60FC8
MSIPASRRRGGAASAAPDDGLAYPNQPELALAAVLQLLSRFPARQSPAVAKAIADHLQVIGNDARMAGCVRECASRLVDDWRAYAMLSESSPTPAAGSQVH